MQAQADFKPGYLVQLNGDTVRGLVDYRDARRTSVACRFRRAAGAATEVLSPVKARGFGAPGEAAYRSCLVPLPDSAGQPRLARPLFLEILTAGPPAALYLRRGTGGEVSYYVQKDPGVPLQELAVRRQTIMVGSRQYDQEIPVFRGVLSEQFADCPTLLLSLAKTEFKPSSLIAAVQRYNACRRPGTAPVTVYKAPTHLAFDVLLGLQGSQLTFSGFEPPVDGRFRAGLTPEVGLGLSVSSRVVRYKLAFRLEAHYARQYYEDEYVSRTPAGGSPFLLCQSRFQADYLRVPLVLRYLPLTGRVQPFVEIGGAISPLLHLTQESRSHEITTPAPAYGSWQVAYDPANVRHLEYGLLAGAGVQTMGIAGHAVSLLGRLETSNGFLATVINYNTVLRYHLLLAIGLSK